MKLILLDFESYLLKKSEISKENLVTIPFILIILTNLTLDEKGQKQLLCIDKKELKSVEYVLVLKMLEKFFQNIYRPEMDFVTNLIANLSSLKEGRVFLLEYKIYSLFLNQLDKMNNFKIINMLRIFRNCCFEFTEFEEVLLVKEGYMILCIMKLLILTNLKKEMLFLDISSIDGIYFTHFDTDLAHQDKDNINDLILDIFITLTNCIEAFPILVKKGLKKVWERIEERIKGNEFEDRLFVITNFLSSHN